MRCHRRLAQTYVFFGGWGDFFHVFLSYFSWNHGHISRNFFTRTKVSSRLRRGKYDIQAQIAFFHTNQSLYVGIPYQRAAGEEKMSVCGLKITENGCLVCDFKGSGGAPAPRQGIFREISLSQPAGHISQNIWRNLGLPQRSCVSILCMWKTASASPPLWCS